MVVVIPFANDLDKLEENINRWKTVAPSASKFKVSPFVDLLFYFHRDLATSSQRSRVEQLIQKVSELNAFKSIKTHSAYLGKWDDRYPLGPSNMFFKLMLETPLIEDAGYSFMFWMEPDCFPIKSGWLDILYNLATTSGPFWVLGSARRDEFVEDKQYRYAYDHINGNALYRLDDPIFRSYLDAVHEDFSQNFKKYLRSFDVAIALYKKSLKPFTRYSELHHHFVYTDLIQNVYRSKTNVTELITSHPETYIVHGRNLIF